MIEVERRLSFSYSLEENITEEERRVDHIIKRLNGQIKNVNYITIIYDFYDHLVRFSILSLLPQTKKL
jgi:hypothetical protein